MEPKVIIGIVGFIVLAALIVVLLCRHYNNADGSADWEAVGKTIMILLFWWGLIFVIVVRGIIEAVGGEKMNVLLVKLLKISCISIIM